MPKVAIGPLMQVIADHIDVYLKVRRRCEFKTKLTSMSCILVC